MPKQKSARFICIDIYTYEDNAIYQCIETVNFLGDFDDEVDGVFPGELYREQQIIELCECKDIEVIIGCNEIRKKAD